MNKLKLNEIAEIYQGSILTRIKPINQLDEVEADSISMQELSYYVGIQHQNYHLVFSLSKKISLLV